MSISGVKRSYICVLVATFIVGAGLDPKAEPRPVVKQTRLQPEAICPVTLAGSGIESWDDLKGKTIFTGPPAGSASATSEALIKIITGYTAGEDYTAVRLSWGEGFAALAMPYRVVRSAYSALCASSTVTMETSRE